MTDIIDFHVSTIVLPMVLPLPRKVHPESTFALMKRASFKILPHGSVDSGLWSVIRNFTHA